MLIKELDTRCPSPTSTSESGTTVTEKAHSSKAPTTTGELDSSAHSDQTTGEIDMTKMDSLLDLAAMLDMEMPDIPGDDSGTEEAASTVFSYTKVEVTSDETGTMYTVEASEAETNEEDRSTVTTWRSETANSYPAQATLRGTVTPKATEVPQVQTLRGTVTPKATEVSQVQKLRGTGTPKATEVPQVQTLRGTGTPKAIDIPQLQTLLGTGFPKVTGMPQVQETCESDLESCAGLAANTASTSESADPAASTNMTHSSFEEYGVEIPDLPELPEIPEAPIAPIVLIPPPPPSTSSATTALMKRLGEAETDTETATETATETETATATMTATATVTATEVDMGMAENVEMRQKEPDVTARPPPTPPPAPSRRRRQTRLELDEELAQTREGLLRALSSTVGVVQDTQKEMVLVACNQLRIDPNNFLAGPEESTDSKSDGARRKVPENGEPTKEAIAPPNDGKQKPKTLGEVMEWFRAALAQSGIDKNKTDSSQNAGCPSNPSPAGLNQGVQLVQITKALKERVESIGQRSSTHSISTGKKEEASCPSAASSKSQVKTGSNKTAKTQTLQPIPETVPKPKVLRTTPVVVPKRKTDVGKDTSVVRVSEANKKGSNAERPNAEKNDKQPPREKATTEVTKKSNDSRDAVQRKARSKTRVAGSQEGREREVVLPRKASLDVRAKSPRKGSQRHEHSPENSVRKMPKAQMLLHKYAAGENVRDMLLKTEREAAGINKYTGPAWLPETSPYEKKMLPNIPKRRQRISCSTSRLK